MGVPLKRYKRRKNVGDASSPILYYLRQEPGSFKTISSRKIAQRMERVGSLSAQDALHVFESMILEVKEELTEGNKVKIEGLGTFYMTFSMNGVEEEKDCTVKKINRVNIRFMVDNSLRLANDSTATTRGGSNNVQFYIKGESASGSDDDAGGDDSGEDKGGYVDPTV